jgi:shikimate dehydrogenase
MTGRPAVYAVIGDPVGHSISPPMQRAAFAAAGLDAGYVAERVAAEDLRAAWPTLRERYAGMNVTRPLKADVLDLVDEVAPAARRSGSVNTVVIRDRRTTGDSTDGAGFLAALRRVRAEPAERALILGTGGAARAVAAALCGRGATAVLWGRNESAGRQVAADLSSHAAPSDGPVSYAGGSLEELTAMLRGADLVVNATPFGDPSMPGVSPIPDGASLQRGAVVVDLVYRPRRTPLLERAAAEGLATVEGIEMLIEQGARSFELWTRMPAPTEVMRRAAYRAYDAGEEPARHPSARPASTTRQI